MIPDGGDPHTSLPCNPGFGVAVPAARRALPLVCLEATPLPPPQILCHPVSAIGGTDMCAFGGIELRRQERLRRDKRDQQTRQNPLTTVNAFGTAAFGDATTATDVFTKFAFGAGSQRLRR
ncbi:hypothetical protein AXG93_1085s1040 [Marchantia polymorpha subsp. ruderalis]|uniref:Uncharacterized protein n=1 Tax=Marchantia polymorpha subsp. ruderalis TaxID=1480154 RepID=A0A176W117_MARPO|nr:hypothetical protein AXG93_1085s1040 [Marchantia polymorpha subsp. ruderalis]